MNLNTIMGVFVGLGFVVIIGTACQNYDEKKRKTEKEVEVVIVSGKDFCPDVNFVEASLVFKVKNRWGGYDADFYDAGFDGNVDAVIVSKGGQRWLEYKASPDWGKWFDRYFEIRAEASAQ